MDDTSPDDDTEAVITKASQTLQQKAGTGDIDPGLVSKADTFLADLDGDFLPLAEDLLRHLTDTLERIRREQDFSAAAHAELTNAVMQIKANGKMFRYDLVSSLAAITLDFLESAEKLDNDALSLVEVQLVSLKAIILRQIKGAGGLDGHHLKRELEEASMRYFRKKSAAAK